MYECTFELSPPQVLRNQDTINDDLVQYVYIVPG